MVKTVRLVAEKGSRITRKNGMLEMGLCRGNVDKILCVELKDT